MALKQFFRAFLLLQFLTVSASAQFIQDPNDAGVADTVEVVFSVTPVAASNQLQVQMEVWFFNDSNNTVSASMGFSWDNPNLQMDSAQGSPLAESVFNFLLIFFEGQNIALTNSNQRFPFVGSRIFGNGVEMSPSRKLIASYFFTLSSWDVQDKIVFDTLEYNSGTIFKLVDEFNKSRIPFWTGKKIIRDPDFVDPSNLVVSTDTLFFEGVEGAAAPTSQSFAIDSDNDPISFSLFENAPWLAKSPASGVTPANIDVSIITAGLNAGLFFDSIRIDASAENAPLYKYVQLDLSPPPPTIGVTPLNFFFNAIAGGDNPNPRTLTVTNAGGSSLNWTVSNNESWLQLIPFSGLDSGDVTLSVDIVGLPFNTYFDTIVVTDPAATNDPVRVPVQLTVASDLPLIEVDSTFIVFIVPTGTSLFFDRTFEVRNGGGGSMNFRVEHNPGRIQNVTPDSAAAPATVSITYKQSVIPGLNLLDTLWVFSDEASNSPVMVVTLLHLVDQPAVLSLDTDTLDFHLFECGQGLSPVFQSKTFDVFNTGGDNPLEVSIVHQSEIFQIGPMIELAPATFNVTLKDTLPPVGTYVDTVEVTALFSLNRVDTVILWLNVTEGDQPPVISPTDSGFVISYEETTNPQVLGPITVFNQFGGCMPWALSESIPWLTATATEGNVEEGFSLVVDAANLTFGELNGDVSIISGAATNSPFDIPVQLLVWRRGDWDFNGDADIADLTAMIAFLFIFDSDPPGPSPVSEVGDIDCDGKIDIADLTEFINHLFINFPPLNCGL